MCPLHTSCTHIPNLTFGTLTYIEQLTMDSVDYPLQAGFVDANNQPKLAVFSDMPPQQPVVQRNVKVVLVGNAEVGKTKIVNQLLTRDFVPRNQYLPTIGVEVHSKRFDDHPEVCFNIWDTAGHPKFSGLQEGYYVNGDIGIVVADPAGIAHQEGDKTLDEWLEALRPYCPITAVVSSYDSFVSALRMLGGLEKAN